MDNASSLIADAAVLYEAESDGRARSLTVLAQEELGKALWIDDTFEGLWSEGSETPRAVDALKQHGSNHTRKYLEAFVFGDELASFWGDYDALRTHRLDGESGRIRGSGKGSRLRSLRRRRTSKSRLALTLTRVLLFRRVCW